MLSYLLWFLDFMGLMFDSSTMLAEVAASVEPQPMRNSNRNSVINMAAIVILITLMDKQKR